MPYCGSCGTQAGDGERFCGSCGASHAPATATAAATTATVAANATSGGWASTATTPTQNSWLPAQEGTTDVLPTPPAQPASAPAQREGEARFVGDAQPLAGISITRMLNAACYIISGIAMFVISTQPGIGKGWPVVIGIGMVLYGGKILFTRSSYWVSSIVYLIALGSVIAAISAIKHA